MSAPASPALRWLTAALLFAGAGLSIVLPFVSATLLTIAIGAVAVVAGVSQVLRLSGEADTKGKIFRLLSGLLYVGGGIWVLAFPIDSEVSLTLFVGFLLAFEGVMELAAAATNLRSKALAQSSSKGFFGTRAELGSDYLTYRAMGAMLGIYGNSSAEALYASQQTGPDGKVLDGRRKWVLRFPAGQLPPVSEFWSITMYNLPQRLLDRLMYVYNYVEMARVTGVPYSYLLSR